MSSVSPCICTQFTDPQAVFLRSLTHYDSFKNVRSFFTTQWHVCNHVVSVRFRVKGPPTIPLLVASAGSRGIRGSKRFAGLLRLSRVRCCLSSVPAKSSPHQAFSAAFGCLHCHAFVCVVATTVVRFSIRLALKPYFSTVTSRLKSASFSALRAHAERLPLAPQSKVSLVFTVTAPLPRPFIIPVLSRWDWPHIGLQQDGPILIGSVTCVS